MTSNEMDELEKIEVQKVELELLTEINASDSQITHDDLHLKFKDRSNWQRVYDVLNSIANIFVRRIGKIGAFDNDGPVRYEKNKSTEGRIIQLKTILVEYEAAELRKFEVLEDLELTVLSKIEELSSTPPRQKELLLSMKSDGVTLRAALVKVYDMGFVEKDADAPTLDERSFKINADGRKQIDKLKRRMEEAQRKARELEEMNERARNSQIISDAANESSVETNKASRRNNRLTLFVAFIAVGVSILSFIKDLKKKDKVDLGPWKDTNILLEKQRLELSRIADKLRVDTIPITKIKYLRAKGRARKYDVINISTDKVVIDSTRQR